MAKQAKSQEKKATVSTKSQGSVKGNFPAKKTWVTKHSKAEGFKSVELETCRGNYEPAKTGDRDKDAENMRAYRESYRADLKRLAQANKSFKPKSLFDVYVLKGGDARHPMQLAQRVIAPIKNNTVQYWGKEMPIFSTK